MSDAGPLVSEDDLHAFVDNQLDADRRPVVMCHLQENADAAARVAAYAEQREALRAAFAAKAAEAVPTSLNVRWLQRQRQDNRRIMWRAAAAVVLAFGLGGGGGWFLRLSVAPSPNSITILVQEAVANHVVYTADRRRPTELGAEQRDDLARWVSNRINRTVAPPDLSDTGYRFMGGRLAATPEGPAGMFMYQDDKGARLTVFVRPVSATANTPIERVGTASIDGCAWIDKGIGYTVVAKVPNLELRHLAEQVRHAVDAG